MKFSAILLAAAVLACALLSGLAKPCVKPPQCFTTPCDFDCAGNPIPPSTTAPPSEVM